jgi:UDP-glucose 4-epimerase
MRKVLITGISSYLGACLARALEASDEVGFIAGVGSSPPPIELERTEFLRADIRSPIIHKVLTSTGVDTVVHSEISSSTLKVGGRPAQKERNIIGTMQLLAACQRTEEIRKVVVRSSTAVYGAEPGDPSVLSEGWSGQASIKGGYSRDVSDAETYARDFGRRRPDVDLTLLRVANIVGPQAVTSMTQLYSLPAVPTALGFDPRLQMLHEEDAVEALRRAVLEDHPGVFNVAPDGILYHSQAIRLARRLPMPVLMPLGEVTGSTLRRLKIVDFPIDQLGLLIHGRIVDNTRLKEVFGFRPAYTSLEAFKDFLRARGDEVAGPPALASWERELYSLITGGRSQRTYPHVVKEGA